MFRTRVVTYFAFLLGPDDQLISEMALRTPMPIVRVARMRKFGWADESLFPAYDIVEFEFRRNETEMYKLLHGPNVCVYRQVGW
jgi:hypothetical protein